MLCYHTVLQIVILLNLTLIGGILPLIERKYLSLIQRRVGPKFVGYKGRLQFIADALKMFLKGALIPRYTNSYFFLFWPILFLSILYTLYLNAYWGVNIILVNIEYNILFLTIISLLLNFCIFFTGFFSKNKYAIISSQRAVVLIFCGELLLTVFYLTVIFAAKSFSLSVFSFLQQEYIFAIQLLAIQNLVIILLLVEVNKSPFDLVEAETELVTGFHTEYGAFFFALFYLGEYFHIFFTSVILVLICSGF